MTESKLKVLFLNHGSEMGGAEVVLLTLLEEIDKATFECWLVCPEPGELTERARRITGVSVQVIPLPESALVLRRNGMEPLSALRATMKLVGPLLRMWSFVRQKRFNLIYTNSTKAHLYGSALGLVSRVPVVWRVHDSLCDEVFDKRLVRLFVAAANSVPKKVLCVSASVAAYQRAAGVKDHKVAPIYNGMSLSHSQVNAETAANLRSAFRLPSECDLVGWFGRLTHWKGVHVLLEAAQHALKEHDNLYFLIVGGALYETEAYYRSLLLQAQRAGFGDRVIFAGYRRDAMSLMSGVDVLTHTSVLPDPLPTVLIEGSYLRKAMIASLGGGVAEIVRDEIEAILVPPNDAKALAYAIGRLVKDRGLRERLGLAARERATRMFSLRRYAEEIENALTEACSRGSCQGRHANSPSR